MKIFNSGIKVKKHINLLPKHTIEAKELTGKYNLSLYGFLLIILVSFFLITSQFNLSASLKESKLIKTKEIEALSFIEAEENKLAKLNSIVKKRVDFEVNIDKSNSNMLHVIDLLEEIRNDNVDITNLQDKIVNNKDGKKEYTITISGICKTNEDVAQIEIKLRESKMFATVFVPNISQTLPANNYILEKPVKFSVQCVFPIEEEVDNE